MLEYWVKRNEDNQKNDSFQLIISIIPSFHYSTIPSFRHEAKIQASKKPVHSISCRNSETLIYGLIQVLYNTILFAEGNPNCGAKGC